MIGHVESHGRSGYRATVAIVLAEVAVTLAKTVTEARL
jgi:hypothetical protein